MRKVSPKKSYRDKYSDVKYSQIEINANLKESKAKLIANQFDIDGYNYCETCRNIYVDTGVTPPDNMESKILDCAHIKPVSVCKADGEIEKIWDIGNMVIECRTHHKQRDGLV